MLRSSRASLGAALALSAAAAACSHNPRPVAPAPAPPAAPAAAAPAVAVAPMAAPIPTAAPAPLAATTPADARTAYVLAGEWEWSALYRDEPFSGTLSLQRAADAWSGTMRVNGEFDAVVRSGAMSGNTVRVVFDSPQGDLVLVAVFTDPNTLSGRVDVVADGASATFSAHRR